MIVMWLAIVAFLHSSVVLVPGDASAGTAWVQLLLMMVVATGTLQLAATQRRLPWVGVQGQWLMACGVLALLLTEGGVPGQPGSVASLIGLDAGTRQLLAPLARIIVLVGLWQGFNQLTDLRHRSLNALQAELHEAMTELVLPVTPRHRPAPGARNTRSGLTETLRAALDQIGETHRLMRNKVVQEPNNIAARLALHRRLLDDPTQRAAALAHGADFVNALYAAERMELALSVACDCCRLDNQYFPVNAAALDLAHQANSTGQHAQALRLLRHYDVRNPGDTQIPRALYYSAQALGGLGKIDLAQAVLNGLVGKFPDDLLAADAIALSARLAMRRQAG
ncbi:MAG: hypothetical protein QM776_12040 [Rhodocyclaceae bacterium]